MLRPSRRSLVIEDRGSSRINRLASVAGSKTTGQRVVELAWTAGPVTLVASIGGYYVGHGKALPKETLIFFIAYTVIAGVIGLGSHLIYRFARENRESKAQEQLTQVIGRLPDRVLQLRNLSLQALDGDARQLESCRILLQEVDLGPQWLGLAVRNLGASDELVHAAEDVELYRRAGMTVRVSDIQQQWREEFAEFVQRVAELSPPLADSLAARLRGERPDLRQGMPRTPYFIERVFAAIDDDNDTLMTLADVQEIYALLFELMSGRRIPILVFDYAGDGALARATNVLEKERLRFRIARSRSYSRLLALATLLAEQDAEGQLSAPQGLSGNELLAFCSMGMEKMVSALAAMPKKAAARNVLRRRLTIALDLYHRAFIANRKTGQEHERFQKQVERWQRRVSGQLHAEVDIDTEQGLQIIEDEITLSDHSKLKAAAVLYPHFMQEARKEWGSDVVAQARAMKQMAIRIALVLEEHIGLRRPEVQRAITSANGLNMGYFESELSTRTKIAWGESMVRELEKDMRQAAEALVGAIYRYYGVKLSPDSQQLLAERYQVDVSRLQQVYLTSAEESVAANAPIRPFTVPKAPLHWRLAPTR